VSPIPPTPFSVETVNEKILKVMKEVPLDDYNPLHYHSNFHSAFDELLKDKQSIPTSTRVPGTVLSLFFSLIYVVKEVNSIKSLRNMPTMPVRIQRIETPKKR
jgi:hypothetical protein